MLGLCFSTSCFCSHFWFKQVSASNVSTQLLLPSDSTPAMGVKPVSACFTGVKGGLWEHTIYGDKIVWTAKNEVAIVEVGKRHAKMVAALSRQQHLALKPGKSPKAAPNVPSPPKVKKAAKSPETCRLRRSS